MNAVSWMQHFIARVGKCPVNATNMYLLYNDSLLPFISDVVL